MHVGIDATCWHNERGYGRHARALLTALLHLDERNQYTFFSDHPLAASQLPANAHVCQVPTTRPTVEAASAQGNRSLRDMWRMSRAMANAGLDVLLYPTVYSYVPVWSRARKIVMIHDVIAERFPQLTLPRTAARWFWQAKVGMARWQADMIVTVSEHARQQIVGHFHLPPDHVQVVGEASDPVFRRLTPEQIHSTRLDELGLLDGTAQLVYLGGFNPHKNLEMLLDVFADLIADDPGRKLRLVMVGNVDSRVFHSYIDAVRARIASHGLENRVVFTGFLCDEDLVCLLNRSTALVLPSLLEGFGLPAVEAAACGCPVVATTESPLPELLGAGGLFVAPHDRAGWRGALTRVLSDSVLRQQMGQAGWQAARQLTWEAAAAQLLRLLEQLNPTCSPPVLAESHTGRGGPTPMRSRT
jgi:glycosyltransferase involved in cell wall biosynthesis